MTPDAESAPLARLDGVTKVYGEAEAAVHALRGIDLTLDSGQLVVVLGPSGSGKTTLLNVLGGIEPVTAGRVVLAGQDLTGMSGDELADARRETLGFVFQYFNLIPSLTAEENVAIVAELTGSRVDDRVKDALADVGLTDRATHFPGQLSGGQQQRVAVARALVMAPRMLLCDEPTGSLDLDTGRQVLALLEQAARSHGRTVVVVTHNQAIAATADRVVRMGSGQIVDDTRNPSPTPASAISW